MDESLNGRDDALNTIDSGLEEGNAVAQASAPSASDFAISSALLIPPEAITTRFGIA